MFSRSVNCPGMAALCAVVLAAALVALPTAAHAHNYLVSSTPSEGETLMELPEAFVITTNESLLDLGGENAGFALQVRDARGLYYGDGCVEVEGPSMSAAPALGPPGDYTVIWQVVSADGHTVSGEYGFEWAPASTETPSIGSPTPPVCGDPVVPVPDEPPAPVDPVPGAEQPTDPAVSSDAVWIIGALGAVALAVAATLFALRRRRN